MSEHKMVDRLIIQKKRKDITINIRYPKKSDFVKIHKFDNRVRKETKFLDIIKPISINQERKWFLDILKGIKKKNYIYLIAENNGDIVGACSVRRQKEETYHHVGVYDIVIRKDYWGKGIGDALTRNILDLAKIKLKLKIIRLILYSGNKPAEKLYLKYKFKVAGRIPKGVLHGKKWMDEIIYYKLLSL